MPQSPPLLARITRHAIFSVILFGLIILVWPFYAFAQEVVVEDETDVLVGYAANIEFMKGHLAQAVANKQNEEQELAIAHAGHPVIEVYYLIEEKLTEHDPQLNTQLKGLLTELAQNISSMPTSEVEARVNEIDLLLDQAKSAVINQRELDDPEFNALIIISVLLNAEIEYEEAIQDGQIVNMIEYQDCRAFIARANVLSDSIKDFLPTREGNTISELYVYLDSLIDANTPFEDVRLTMRSIGHNYAQVFAFEAFEGVFDGQVIIDRINNLLDQALEEYINGNPDRARARVLDAYLGNYEYIELDIAEENRPLMLKIEIAMHETLVKMIEAGRPASEIESLVSEIKADLEMARTVVVPEFSHSIIAVVAILVASILIVTRIKGTAPSSQSTNI